MGMEILVSAIAFAAMIITWAIAPNGAPERPSEAMMPATVPSSVE